MKKKLLLVIGLIVVLGIGISAVAFSASGEEDEVTKAFRTAAQAYKRISSGDISLDTEDPNFDRQAIMGYYKGIPITRDQVIYIRAMDQAHRKPVKTDKEAIFSVAKEIYTLERARELDVYPSEERMDSIFASETESFDAKLEENLEFCSQVGLSQDEMIAWSVQRMVRIEAKSEVTSNIVLSLCEEEQIEDETLADLVQSLISREEGVDVSSVLTEIFDRYVALQIEDQITYVNEDTGEENNVVSE